MSVVTAASLDPENASGQVFLNEAHVEANLDTEAKPYDGRWYLDTGASNHMSGDRAAFVELDQRITGSVKFGDGSTVEIHGRGTVMFTIRSGNQRALSNVYYIPRLKTSIVSLGQLDESGCDTRIHVGTMTLFDRQGRELAQVWRNARRLYFIQLEISSPACLAAQHCSDAWRWHACFGHQHFEALRRMARSNMVRGLPAVEHADQLCDACLIEKQRRAPFPQQAKYRAKVSLELVHADICGPISPPMPGGKKYFLLLIDDASRYMWAVTLATKDGAEAAIK
jgi:hypothetical protein